MVSTAEEAKLETCHWTRSRFDAELQHNRTNIHPLHWPPNVRAVSLEGLLYLGLDDKGHLYLDGQEVHTVRRWSSFERTLAALGLAVAMLGAGASVAQAYVALHPPAHCGGKP